MHQFTVLPEAFGALKRIMFTRFLFLFAIGVLVIVVFPLVKSGANGELGESTWLTVLLTAAILVFTSYRGLKRQTALLASYKLIITGESITREMLNTPSIVISYSEVREIRKGVHGGFAIVSDSKLNAIGVPAHIERHEELEQLLVAIKPLTVETSTPLAKKLQYPIALFGIAAMSFTYYSSDKYLSTFSALIFSGIMIYSLFIIQKSKNTDQKMKRLSYFILIPILSVIGSVIMKWML